MKLFCARCRELYDHNVPGGNYIDGAFFGSTFPHLFLQTYGELRPQRCTRQYVPRVFGFKVHQGQQQLGGAGGAGGSSSSQAPESPRRSRSGQSAPRMSPSPIGTRRLWGGGA